MKENSKVEITVSNRTVIRIIAMIVITYFAFQALRSVSNILQLIFIAFFLSIALNPAVAWLVKRLHIKSRAFATAVAYVLVVGLLAGMISYVVPPLVQQTVGFLTEAPQTIENLSDPTTKAGQFVERYQLEPQIEAFSDNLRDRTSTLRQPVITTAGRVGGALISIITVLVLTFMMLVEGPRWLKKYSDFLTPKRRTHQQYLAKKMYEVISGYAIGQVVLAAIAASFAFVTLLVASALLHVSVNAIALAGILIFTGLIPMIGNTIGGVIVVVSCLFVSLPLAIIMAIFFVVYQQIENVSLQPYVQAKYNELTPLLVFVAALLGIGIAGFLGALVAIPMAGCLKILFVDYLAQRKGVLAD